jgi:hypothetical protein
MSVGLSCVCLWKFKDHLFDGIVFAQFRGRFADRDLDSEVEGKAVDAATDGWEGQSPQAVAARERKARTIATGKQLPFSVFSAIPYRANGMNDISGGQAITPGQFRLACLATVEQTALAEKFRASSAMDCPINPSATEQ